MVDEMTEDEMTEDERRYHRVRNDAHELAMKVAAVLDENPVRLCVFALAMVFIELSKQTNNTDREGDLKEKLKLFSEIVAVEILTQVIEQVEKKQTTE